LKKSDATTGELIEEIGALKQRIEELEQFKATHDSMEKALRVSEERFRSLVEATSDWVWEVDRDGVYTYASPNVKDLLGYKPEEVIGKTPFDLMPKDKAKEIGTWFRDISRSRRPFSGLVNVNIHKDGREVVLETNGVPIFDTCGVYIGYRGCDRDVTATRKAEEALQKSEERFRLLAERSQDLIFRMSLVEGRYEYISPAVLEMTGYSPEEYYGDPFLIRRVIHPDWRDYFFREWESLVEGNAPSSYEYEIIHRSGEERWFHQRNVLIRDSAGRPVALEGIVTNITERRQREKEREELIFELRATIGKVKLLSGLIPVCASCKRIRNDKGYWEQIEAYIRDHSEAEFSHSICPECAKRLYGGILDEDEPGPPP
jgi:PAS domain S-box-containing protein